MPTHYGDPDPDPKPNLLDMIMQGEPARQDATATGPTFETTRGRVSDAGRSLLSSILGMPRQVADDFRTLMREGGETARMALRHGEIHPMGREEKTSSAFAAMDLLDLATAGGGAALATVMGRRAGREGVESAARRPFANPDARPLTSREADWNYNLGAEAVDIQESTRPYPEPRPSKSMNDPFPGGLNVPNPDVVRSRTPQYDISGVHMETDDSQEAVRGALEFMKRAWGRWRMAPHDLSSESAPLLNALLIRGNRNAMREHPDRELRYQMLEGSAVKDPQKGKFNHMGREYGATEKVKEQYKELLDQGFFGQPGSERAEGIGSLIDELGPGEYIRFGIDKRYGLVPLGLAGGYATTNNQQRER